jgi:hypothetical protein
MEGFEYDVYEYFGELEYGSDSYWDARMKHLGEAGLGEKRKSGEEEDTEARMVKKRRKDARGDVQAVRDNVLYVPFERRLAPLPPVVGQGEGKFALLPDWKERFPERGSQVLKRREMPAEMRRAAEEVVDEEDDDEEDENGSADREDGDEMEVEMGEDGEWEDEDDEDGEQDGEEESAAGLDQDLVMQVLRQKLADSGLGDVDESMFKDVIAKMMSGDGDSEDAVGGLASLLLGQEGGGGKAFEGFLAGQGVQLGGAEGDDDHESEGESEDDDNETNSRPTKKAKANPTRERSQKPSTTASSSTSRPKLTSKTPTASRTRSNPSETTALHESPLATRTSPTVVPSPLPPAIASAAAATSSTRPSRKRRAPSLDEPSVPETATATASSAKPPAKRRRATPASSRSETPADDSEPRPTRRRTTRSAAASAGAGKGRG